jgi:hypothetical protein
MAFTFPSIPATPQGLLIKIGIVVIIIVLMLATLKFYGHSQYELGKAEAITDVLEANAVALKKLQDSADVLTNQSNESATFLKTFSQNQETNADRIIQSVRNKKLTVPSSDPNVDCIPSRDFGEAWNQLGKGVAK